MVAGCGQDRFFCPWEKSTTLTAALASNESRDCGVVQSGGIDDRQSGQKNGIGQGIFLRLVFPTLLG
jgi:hypothetical protein